MTKKIFIKTIKDLKKQIDIERKNAERLEKVYPNAFSADFLPTNILYGTITDLLVAEFDDKSKWIEHYLWELDFGQENYRLKVYDGKKEIPMETPEDLYNILVNK